MTVALCLQCGQTKVGAFSYCPGCGFTPETHVDLAKSLLLSDRHLDAQSLEAAGAKIKGGEEVILDQESLDGLVKEMEATGFTTEMPIGCKILVWAPMITLLLLLGLLIYIKVFL